MMAGRDYWETRPCCVSKLSTCVGRQRPKAQYCCSLAVAFNWEFRAGTAPASRLDLRLFGISLKLFESSSNEDFDEWCWDPGRNQLC